jgi:alpha-beta hydrolase superfamily lysophospholipase
MVSNQQKAVGFPIPYLIMYATNDRIVDSQGSEGFSTRNHSSQKAFTSSQAYCYKDFAPHELHNSSLKEDTYKKIFSWLKARVEADAQ